MSASAVCVVSKPYQLMMGLSALATEDRSAAFYIVSRGFSDAPKFLAMLEGHPDRARIDSVEIIGTHQVLAGFKERIRGTDLFVEDDRFSLYALFTSLEPSSLRLIEEGVGTYVTDYWHRRPGPAWKLKAAKWAAISAITGCGFRMGSGRETSAIYCMRPELFAYFNPDLMHKVVPIAGLTLFREHFAALLDERMRPAEGDTARLAMLGWHETEPGWKDRLAAPVDALYVKPHPHQPKIPAFLSHGRPVSDLLPAEFVIEHLARRYRSLDVYHAASAACVLYPFAKPPGLSFHTTAMPRFYRRLNEAFEARGPQIATGAAGSVQ